MSPCHGSHESQIVKVLGTLPYQPTPILHEAPEQDYQNLKTPLQSVGALFNLQV
jgi:hypothetical protein